MKGTLDGQGFYQKLSLFSGSEYHRGLFELAERREVVGDGPTGMENDEASHPL